MKPLKTIQKHDINENLDFFQFFDTIHPLWDQKHLSGILWTPGTLWNPLHPLESLETPSTLARGVRQKNNNNPSGGQRAGN